MTACMLRCGSRAALFSVLRPQCLNNMLEVPVYVITGFLESGKTTFIREVLESPDFADGEKTLVLLCEEGEEEYDEKQLNRHNIYIEQIDEEGDLAPEKLEVLHRKHKPKRVFVEFNGTWDAAAFTGGAFPRRWELAQIITLVDGSTFEIYLQNMRQMMSNIFMDTELVVFNRCTTDMDLQKFRRTVKAVNSQAVTAFEDANGEQIDIGKAQPPFDLSADPIEIPDEEFGLWYLDAMESKERYDGKTVHFKGKVMIPRGFPQDCFIPGRNAMTCCVNDIRFIGFICHSKHTDKLSQKQWIEVTAEIRYEFVREYNGEGPVLYAKHLKSTEPPAEDVVLFN